MLNIDLKHGICVRVARRHELPLLVLDLPSTQTMEFVQLLYGRNPNPFDKFRPFSHARCHFTLMHGSSSKPGVVESFSDCGEEVEGLVG